jgi:hypothetical protein
MSQPSSFAVVLEGDLFHDIVVQDWPEHLPLPVFTIVDYDIEGVPNDELIRLVAGDTSTYALCRSEAVTVFESTPGALSPRAVLAALDEPVID